MKMAKGIDINGGCVVVSSGGSVGDDVVRDNSYGTGGGGGS